MYEVRNTYIRVRYIYHVSKLKNKLYKMFSYSYNQSYIYMHQINYTTNV